MDLLKLALTTLLALVSLDYTEGAGDIILAVDASSEGCSCRLLKEKSTRQDMKAEFGLAQRRNMMQPSGNVEGF